MQRGYRKDVGVNCMVMELSHSAGRLILYNSVGIFLPHFQPPGLNQPQ
jgi:hypothetical protein